MKRMNQTVSERRMEKIKKMNEDEREKVEGEEEEEEKDNTY